MNESKTITTKLTYLIKYRYLIITRFTVKTRLTVKWTSGDCQEKACKIFS